MAFEVFSEGWARACASAINANAAYRAASATWEGGVMLHVFAPEADAERRVYLDLWRGECREARIATAKDDVAARYILSADGRIWRQLLTGATAPVTALMMGRLRLTKGALAELLPHAEGARQLVSAVASVEAFFPEPT